MTPNSSKRIVDILAGNRDPETVILDLNCDESLKILRRATDAELFGGFYHWVLIDGQGVDRAAEILGDLNVRWDSEISYLLCRGGSAELYDVW